MEEDIIVEVSKGNSESETKQCKGNHSKFQKNIFYNAHPFDHDRISELSCHYFPGKYNNKEVYQMYEALYHLVVFVDVTGRLNEKASGRVLEVTKDNIILVATVWHVGKYCGCPGIEMSCLLDFNQQDEEKKTPIYSDKFTVIKIRHFDKESDVCILECRSNKTEILSSLRKKVERFNEIFSKLYSRMKRKKIYIGKCITSEWTLSDLVIIISHPHGGPKVVSVGHRIRRDSVIESVSDANVPSENDIKKYKVPEMIRYSYTAEMCPGCSGAPVIVFGAPSSDILLMHAGKHSKDYTNLSTLAHRVLKDKCGNCFYKIWKTCLANFLKNDGI